jgi:hypothetical protein
VLSDRGLCDELITHPEESYRLWCVVLCDLENFKNEEAMTRVGSQRPTGEENPTVYYYVFNVYQSFAFPDNFCMNFSSSA